MKEIGIYVHIPFCKQKCKYCDFISFENKDEYFERYVQALNNSIRECQYNDFAVNTIYFGGGTPSVIDSKYIISILKTIKEKFNVLNDAEITIEVNPGTITKEKLLDYYNFGINRLSIGLQSTHNNLLKLIGRIHTYEQFEENYYLAKEIGFKNINIDLMLALPTQTLKELEKSVKSVISLNPNHISLYSLILEEKTKLKEEIEKGIIGLPSDELERKMYHSAKKILEENGYNQYEISNFSKKGNESKHNMNCWNQDEYLGFGLASHSYFNNVRFSNIINFNKYIENIENKKFADNIIINERQTKEDKMKEYMLLGFRKLNGISISEFEQRFQINPLFYFRFELSKLEEELLIEVDLDDIRLTKRGLDLANIVFSEFI